MTKLIRIENPQFSRFEGYISAAQHVFRKGQLTIGLEATLFEITDGTVTNEEVVGYAYVDDSNPIEHSSESTVDEMIAKVNAAMTISRKFLNPEYMFGELIESNLREGYWNYLEACFEYKRARVVELGYHVPYVNVGNGFTYVLYSADLFRCMLLVGNSSD